MTFETAVLALDDSQMVLETLEGLFTDEGFHVDTVTTLNDAREHLIRSEYDVVICDWDLGPYAVGHPGDELFTLSDLVRLGDHSFQLICFSGLRRDVPEGVEQFRKDQVLELRDYVRNIQVSK